MEILHLTPLLLKRSHIDPMLLLKRKSVGHVQKRLGTRLRKLKSKLGTRKLKDGKGIGGKGRLTRKVMDKMQNYYGLAIRQNENNLQQMMNDVMAGLYHISSSDANPHHDMCPKGKDSWCGWQKSMAQNKSYRHKTYIPAAVMEEVLPIYKYLSKRDLLTRCLESFTQNANKSLNNLIWARCPKKFIRVRRL